MEKRKFKNNIPFVLIVEDDRDVAAYYRQVMDLAGYRTDVAENGSVALKIIGENTPDVVLLDLSLPGVSGLTVLEFLSREEKLKDVHVVVITGNMQMLESLTVEPDLVLTKPISPYQLTGLVERLYRAEVNSLVEPFSEDPFDSESGLYSRVFFTSRLQVAIRNAGEHRKTQFAVIRVNVRLNPTAELTNPSLRVIGRVIKSCVRPVDTVASFDRYDYFLLVENLESPEVAEKLVGRLQTTLAEKMPSNLEFSIHQVICDERYKTPEEIFSAGELIVP